MKKLVRPLKKSWLELFQTKNGWNLVYNNNIIVHLMLKVVYLSGSRLGPMGSD